MRLELYGEALAVAERGKSRLLLDLLMAQELRPKNAPEHLQRRYEELLFRARAIADELERPDPLDLPPDAREERRAQLRQEHQQVSRELGTVLAEIRRADPNFLPAAQPITHKEILQLGLALGPLYAGAPTVWGTLWAVSDAATGLLMGKAYELLQQGRSKAEALREAQLWLRELTAGEVVQILKAQAANHPAQAVVEMERMALAQLLPAKCWFKLMDADERPFAHPYYWAAFQCVGV